ncbi:hypothetical protein, partial [Calditerricola satsumensis]|uniref:hypothetical protein n=1 Tax=Calditerricola satsumensis TaxID=373054 RepID=UPI001C481403
MQVAPSFYTVFAGPPGAGSHPSNSHRMRAAVQEKTCWAQAESASIAATPGWGDEAQQVQHEGRGQCIFGQREQGTAGA